jgi:AcrR family transcriptional regulator
MQEKVSNKRSKSYHHGSLKESILEKASEIIAKNGAVDFSIREISQLCGVSPSAIYKHYKSRNEIAVSLALKGVNILKAEFGSVASSRNPTLFKFAKTYISFAKSHEGYFRAMYFRQIGKMKEYDEIESITDQLNTSLYNAMENSIPPKKKEKIIQKMFICAHGISSLTIDGCMNLSEGEIDKIIKDTLKEI